jgi:hypothetical protein
MKTLRLLLVLSIALTLIAVVGPVQAPRGEDGVERSGTLSCHTYASEVSGTRNLFGPGISGGDYGPFAEGIYTFTLTPISGSATFRIVADPAGTKTIAGPFTTPATVSITMGAPGSQPTPGMGIYFDSISPDVQKEGVTISVSVSCSAGGCDTQVDIPAQAVVGTFVANASAYYEPGQLITNPPVVIEAGKSYWVAGQDATGMYRKVLISCQWVWVLRDTVGPTYDDVWNGKPLPTDVVN